MPRRRLTPLLFLGLAAVLVVPAAHGGAATLSLPGDITVPAESAGGATVTYASSGVNAHGKPLAVVCNPPSGAVPGAPFTATLVFPIGQTAVTCTIPEDDPENPEPRATGSFLVTVVDTAPVLTQPADATSEATGPNGSVVNYPTPAATDAVDGPVPAKCTPASGSVFPLATTPVVCSAADSAGNTTSVSFAVTVRDTTSPVLTVPAAITVQAGTSDGAPATDPAIARFLASAVARDMVDGNVAVAHDAAPVFRVGTTTVTFAARDRSGNATSSSSAVTVVLRSGAGSTSVPANAPPAPAAPPGSSAAQSTPGATSSSPASTPGATTSSLSASTPGATSSSPPSTPGAGTVSVTPVSPQAATPDRIPPADAGSVVVKAGDRVVRLSWTRPSDADFDHVVVVRSATALVPAPAVVYKGAATRYVDRAVTNGVEYRYEVISYDRAGNRSAGVAAVALPKASRLFSPNGGARVAAPPVLAWARVPGATYYNVQLFLGREKIMSVWPANPRLALARSWTYNGRRYRLTPGTYRWYVWPGLGSRADARYGDLVGEATFVVVGKRR